MGKRRSILVAFVFLLAATVALVGLGSRPASGARPGYFAGVRDAVMRGVDRDFAEGTGVASASFRNCFEGRLREALDPGTITDLASVYRRPGGSAYAAQLLNAIASPLAARCGHRAWVPELTGAAAGLAHTHATGAAAKALGITYGPYLGIRCDARERREGCAKVGIDVVLRRPARAVTAIAGGQTIHLVTPGKHDGVRRHDWVGTFTKADLLPPRPYELTAHPIPAEVELRVRFTDGRRRTALLPHALISPGWG
jgi:hypothetical protein